MNGFSFKRVKNKDRLLEIHKLFFQILDEMHRYYVDETIFEEKKNYAKNNFLEKYSDKNNYAYGLYVDGKLSGFVLAYVEGGIGFIEWLGVEMKHRGKGYGKYVLKSVENVLVKDAKVHKLFADSLISNRESVNNLITCGFQVVAKLNKHWNKQDYYLWEKFTS